MSEDQTKPNLRQRERSSLYQDRANFETRPEVRPRPCQETANVEVVEENICDHNSSKIE